MYNNHNIYPKIKRKEAMSMKESAIVRFAVFVFRKILDIYNGSFLEKIIAAICGFFVRRSENSFFCGIFTKHSERRTWQNSILFRIVSSPVALALGIAGKNEDKLRRACDGSSILATLHNLAYVPLRQYGVLVGGFSLGMLISLAVFGHFSRLNLAVLILLAVFAIFLMLIPSSAAALYASGKIIPFFCGIFGDVNKEKAFVLYKIPAIKVIFVLLFLLGAAAGAVSPAFVTISVVLAVGAALVLAETAVGVYALVMAAPIMPTMVCAAITALTAVSFGIRLVSGREKKYTLTPLSFPIFAFIALAMFASVTSFNTGESIKVFLLYILFVLAYFLIVNIIKTKAEWHGLVTAFILSGFIVASYGLLQNFMGAATDKSWVDEEMFSSIGTRVYSTLDNPNVLGQYLVLVIPVTFAEAWSSKKIRDKFLFLIITAVMCACLLFTWSRAGWVAIILAIGFFLVMNDRRWASLCVLALIVMPFVLPESILSRITSIGNLKDSSSAYRVSVWTASLRMAKDYWLSGIGLGPGAFERVYQQYALNGAGFALHSHNFYIQLVVEMGVLGLVTFVSIIICAFRSIVGISEKRTENKTFAIAAGGAIVGYLFEGIAENLWYNYRMVLVFWIFLALLECASKTSENAVGFSEMQYGGAE